MSTTNDAAHHAGEPGPTGRCGCPLGTVHKCSSHGSIMNPAPETAQQRFDALYISSNEIAERMGVSRPAVLGARKRGVLPDPICVNDGQIYVWERADVEPYLKAWEVSVKLRRGETVTISLQNPTGPNWVQDAFKPAGAAQAHVMGLPVPEDK